jgi:hypothetical protein
MYNQKIRFCKTNEKIRLQPYFPANGNMISIIHSLSMLPTINIDIILPQLLSCQHSFYPTYRRRPANLANLFYSQYRH